MKAKTCVLLFLLLSPAVAYSMEEKVLTQEYIEARYSVFKELRGIYSSCQKKIGNSYYSEFFENCINNKNGKIRKERCGHEAQLATDKFLIIDNGAVSCNYLKPATEDYIKRLEQIVKEKSIRKYK